MKSPIRRVFAVVLVVLLGLVAGCTHPKAPSSGPTGQDADVGAAARAPAGPVSEADAVVPIYADDASRGSRLAPVTIVLFTDFECPFCSRLEATFDRLREEYPEEKLRIVLKHNPLPFHAHARPAAELGVGVLALAGQEAFWRFETAAFRQQRAIATDLLSWGVAAGADETALRDGLASHRWAAQVDRDIALAKRLEAGGTPMSFVNGVLLGGAQPIERFKAAIDRQLEQARALAESGVAKDALYTRLVAGNFKAPAPDDDEEDDDRGAKAEAAAAAAAIEAKVVHKIPAGSAPARGPATAEVTIIEFSDFQCPYCKKVEPTLAQIRREYGDKVRILWRDDPLGFHPRAEPAAELGRAARAQKGDAGFWAVHDALFDSHPKLEDEDLERVAREAKLDVGKAMAAVKAKTYQAAIDADVLLGEDFQASGTPHFFVNGRRLVGAGTLEKFKALIDEELARAQALLKSGTPRLGLYEALVKDGKGPTEPERKVITAAPSTAPFRGAANAKLVIQEVSDFQCPYCKRSEATTEELLKAYPGKIKIVWRDHPLPMHVDAEPAAEAAREAHAQKGNEGFGKMHKLLFENQTALKREDLLRYGAQIGLDVTKLAEAIDTHKHKAIIDADNKATVDAGVTGTPAYFVGPYYLSGAQPLNKFKRAVNLALSPPAPGSASAVVAAAPAAAAASPGLVSKDLAVGNGAAVKSGDKVKVHYVGTLTDGTEFDSSRPRGTPFEFEVGKGRVIKGWDQGLIGMKVGGKRKLTIPPDLAYGDRGAGGKIPPKSTLVFEIELLEIAK